MLKFLKNLLVRGLIGSLAIGGLLSTTITAYADETTSIALPDIQITDFEVQDEQFSPYDGEEAEATFEINRGAFITFEILDEDGEELITLINDEWYPKGEYTVYWNGKDEFDDLMDEGEFSYKLIAEAGGKKDRVTGDFRIQRDYTSSFDTEDPRFRRVYVTKEAFDPGRAERTYIVFTLTAKADLEVSIYDNEGSKVEELLNETNKSAGTYKLVWDGDGYEDREGEYFYKLEASNSSGSDFVTGIIEIDQDAKQENKPNIYKDFIAINDLPYEPKNKNLYFEFRLETDADVTIEIRDESRILVEILEEEDLSAGLHTIGWDGKDQYGSYVDDGIYQYKIIAENFKGKDTEFGNFSIEGVTNAVNPIGRCAGFTDVDEEYKYCDAIEWARSAGIIQGYNDETFRPNNTINRVEALKVILEALDIDLVDAYGQDSGFEDLDRFGWYMDYVETALALGIIHGYPDGTFRPADEINRIEALVMLVNAAMAKTDLILPTNRYEEPFDDTPEGSWYIDYAWLAREYDLTENEDFFFPASDMSRAEMADLLYRFHQEGLDR